MIRMSLNVVAVIELGEVPFRLVSWPNPALSRLG